jgi:hypothetical protein
MGVDQHFNIIQDKLLLLLKQQARLKKDNERLNAELRAWKLKEETYQQKINELNQQVQILKLSTGEMSEKDKKNFERQISQYVREIDKCISYLSQ